MSQSQTLTQTVLAPDDQSPARPLVSILINNYNYGRFLTDAIESALSQTYQPCEVIVVDDGSTDNSQAIITAYGEKIVPVLKQNGGQASAFNAGFQASQGDIVCFLDADDTFAADKAERIVSTFKQHAEAEWCFHPVERVDEQLAPWVNQAEGESVETYQGPAGIYDLRRLMRRGKFGRGFPFECLVTSGMCFKRSRLTQILPMPTDIRITSDDYIKYAALGTSQGYALLEPLAAQRIHGNNAYTYSSAKPLLESKILIQTAYYLRRDFPVIKAYANNLFALGLVCGQQEGKDNRPQPLADIVSDYRQGLSVAERVQVQSKQLYYQYLRPTIKKYLKQ